VKNIKKTIRFCYGFIAGVVSFHFMGIEALSAETSGGWRPLYDEILLWFNFGILVFIFIRYAKTPLMNFLRGRKEKLKQEIESLEEEKGKAADKIKEIYEVLDESEDRFVAIKARILEQGEKKKQTIIAAAQNQSKMMIEDANRRIQYYFVQAKDKLKAEFIDAAIDMALERLPQEISDADNEKFVNEYLASTQPE
jgi:F-type H+-transporting ATPase subunit b